MTKEDFLKLNGEWEKKRHYLLTNKKRNDEAMVPFEWQRGGLKHPAPPNLNIPPIYGAKLQEVSRKSPRVRERNPTRLFRPSVTLNSSIISLNLYTRFGDPRMKDNTVLIRVANIPRIVGSFTAAATTKFKEGATQ